MRCQIFYLMVCTIFLQFDRLSAQDESSDIVYPSGSPILRIFANVHHGLSSDDPSKAFEVRRVYLGYKYQLNEYYSTEVKVDIGSPDDIFLFTGIHRYAYFKTAALYWEKGMWNVRSGIIDTEHYRLQEKFWKHRYIYKSMQDRHKFGPKADLGTTLIFTPFKELSIDASVMNGEGYTDLQYDNAFKYSAGISVYAIPKLIFRIYYDLINREVNQSTLSTFLGYQYQQFSSGAEYNRKFNKDFDLDHHQNGYSAYLMYDCNEKIELFARFDHLSSNAILAFDDPWNLYNDGSTIIAGIQFHPIQQVKLALNFRDWFPKDATQDNSPYIFLNLEVSL